jgi:hypothetical protein
MLSSVHLQTGRRQQKYNGVVHYYNLQHTIRCGISIHVYDSTGMTIVITNLSSVYNNYIKCHQILESGAKIIVEWRRGTTVAKSRY